MTITTKSDSQYLFEYNFRATLFNKIFSKHRMFFVGQYGGDKPNMTTESLKMAQVIEILTSQFNIIFIN